MEIKKPETTEWAEFLSVIEANYRLVLIFVACSCLVAAVVTFFIPKQYTSSAIVFPTESNSLEDVIRNPQFGYDVEADRLIQLLESRMIRDSIVRKFGLVNYYRLDTTSVDWAYRLSKRFRRDFTFTKTEFMSVVISARTKDPGLSANIANEIVRLIGPVREKLLKTNVYVALASLQTEYKALSSDLDSLSRVVDKLARGRRDIRQYLQTERSVALIFDKQQMSDDEAGKALQLVVNQYNVRLTWFYDVQNKLKNTVLVSQRPLPSVYVVESAVPSYKKSFPKYSINLVIAFAGSLIFITLLLFFMHKIRNVRLNLKHE